MSNGYVFPTFNKSIEGDVFTDQGISMRDYFAAKAMQSWLINAFDVDFDLNEDKCARFAYRMADAMLAERERGGEG